MKLRLFFWILILVALAGGFVSIKYFDYVFARNVQGTIIGLERASPINTIITGSQQPPSQVYSFAIAIRLASGEIVTASTEDRQWAVAVKGQCVDAKFLRYPPWELDRAGTFYGARLLHLYDCPGAAPVPIPSSSP